MNIGKGLDLIGASFNTPFFDWYETLEVNNLHTTQTSLDYDFVSLSSFTFVDGSVNWELDLVLINVG